MPKGPNCLFFHQNEPDISASMRKNLPFQKSRHCHGRSKAIRQKLTCNQSASTYYWFEVYFCQETQKGKTSLTTTIYEDILVWKYPGRGWPYKELCSRVSKPRDIVAAETTEICHSSQSADKEYILSAALKIHDLAIARKQGPDPKSIKVPKPLKSQTLLDHQNEENNKV